VAEGIDGVGLATMERVLVNDPKLLSEEQLVRLAHRFSVPRSAADLLSLKGESFLFDDLVQHFYTDDGKGDGRMTADGASYLVGTMEQTGGEAESSAKLDAMQAVGPAAMMIVASRKEMTDEYQHCIDALEADLSRPYREVDPHFDETFNLQYRGSLYRSMKFGLICVVVPSVNKMEAQAEKYLGRRDGVVTAIGLEIHRRRHGNYPRSLDELTPGILPVVPADRITGGEIKYKISDGRPILYSVGCDRVDDGGVAGKVKGELDATAAAQWEGRNEVVGDWILFPGAVLVDPEEGN
jgi:hypothetical protein